MVPMSLTGYESIPAEFSPADWKLILRALQSYVITEETRLSCQNVGDKEWQELEVFSSLARDIEYYLILETGEFTDE